MKINNYQFISLLSFLCFESISKGHRYTIGNQAVVTSGEHHIDNEQL